MKKRIITGSLIFSIINSLICLLSNNYSYFSVLELFDFYNQKGYLNITLLIFNISFISTIIITINALVEEKIQIDKYIQIRSSQMNTALMHIVRLIKEISLIVFSKIVIDFIFFIAFDRINLKSFFHNSILLYISIILWLILFDFLSNLIVNNNILVVFFISAIYISYLLLKHNDLFLLLVIKPYENNILFAKVILLKAVVILLTLLADIIVKVKKEYF